MLRSITLLAVIALAQLIAAQDLCALSRVDSAGKIYKIEDVVACFKSIPANSGWMLNTIISLQQLSDMYAFADINMAEISPWNITADLNSNLADVAMSTFTSDFKFHQAVMDAFHAMVDPQTRYYPPLPYQACTAVKPFALLPKNLGGGQYRIYLAQNLFQPNETYNWPGFNPADYYGWEVVSINNKPTIDYLKDYTKKSSKYKDPIVRLNALWNQRGWGIISPWSPYHWDDLPVETLVVQKDRKEATLELTYRAYCDLTWTSTTEFVQQLSPSSRKRSAAELSGDIPAESFSGDYSKKFVLNQGAVDSMTAKARDIIENSKKRQVSGSTLSRLTVLEDNSLAILIHIDENFQSLPVLKIQSFRPRNALENYWVGNITALGAMMKNFNWTYLIVDVSNNNGGYHCEAYLLSAALARDIADLDVLGPTSLWNPWTVRKTPFMTSVYEGGISDSFLGGYINTQTGNPESPLDFYNAPSKITPYLSTITKSTYYPGVCKDWLAGILPNLVYWPQNVMVVSDGICTGACAMFVSKMRQHKRALVITHGGSTLDTDDWVNTASMPGGLGWTWKTINSKSSVTTPLPTSAEATVVWHAVYASDTNGERYPPPLEFIEALYDPMAEVKFWDAVRYGDINTPEGKQAFNMLYYYSTAYLPNTTQTIPQQPSGLPPIFQSTPEYSTPEYSTPGSSTPYYSTPDADVYSPYVTVNEDNVALIVIFTIIGAVVAVGMIIVIVRYVKNQTLFGISLRGTNSKGPNYNRFDNKPLQETLLSDNTAEQPYVEMQ